MKPVFDARKPYSGLVRSLVIAIDVGTTFSGVSYAILEPGEIPKIHGVTRFPGQENVAGNSKIPSILFYNKKGELQAAGAEADDAGLRNQAEDEEWVKVELFKLRLRPRTMTLSMNGLRLGPLPPRKTPVHIFGDFLSYLYTCTTSFIKDTHANGSALLASVIPDHVEFVLAHPNGWEGAQQAKMRRAAIYGKLIADTPEGRARIRFVTEGEASLHACVLSGLAADVLSSPSKHGFLIADAGGGTLDISSYAVKGTNPLVIEEIAPPDCVFAGSVFVSRRAREFFELKLKGSQYSKPESLDHITKQFDEKTKRLFRDKKDTQFVPFGSPFDKDPAYGIRNGQLRLTGSEVANLFEPSIDATFNAIKRQIENVSVGTIRSVFLVGGYAASPWLFSQLRERLKPLGVVVSRPDTQTSKAVADGAIAFYCDHHVSARVSKFMYGVEYLRKLDPNDPEHIARKEKLCELPSGPSLLPDAFDCILARNVKVKESTVFSRKYCTELTSLSMLKVFEVEVWCYRGGNEKPRWIERHSDTFSTLCIVKADLSMLSGSAAPKVGKNGKTYWTIVFSVEISFGLTEFEARIKWVQEGQTKYGPATIVFNERGHRTEEEEPDFFPEDDAITASGKSYASSSSRSDRHRSSRAATPAEGLSRRSSRAGESIIPEVARASSTRGSNPPTPTRSAHRSLDDRDSTRERDRDRDSYRSSRSHRTSSAIPSRVASPIAGDVPSHSTTRSRTQTPAPPTPGLEYVDPPSASRVSSPRASKHATPMASPKPEMPSLWDATPTTATAPAAAIPQAPGNDTPPPPPVISRAASSASGMFGSRSPPKTLSIFGEDPKGAFGTPGAGIGLGIGAFDGPPAPGATGSDRPVSIFGEDLVPGGGAGSVFGEPANAGGMPGGLFDSAEPSAPTPIAASEAGAGGILGGWGLGSMARSLSSRVASARGTPPISRAASTVSRQGALSPLNPSAQEADPLAAAGAAIAASAAEGEASAAATQAAAPPKIDTNVALAISTATPKTPGDAETPTTAGGTKKKKRKESMAAKKLKEEATAAAAAAEKVKQEEEERKKGAEAEEQARVEAEKKVKEEADAAAAAAEAAEAEAKRKADEEAAAAAAAAAAAEEAKKLEAEAEAKKAQEEEEKKRAEEEAAKKKKEEEEEEARKKEAEEEASKAASVKPKKENMKQAKERKKREEQERKDAEKKEKEEKERIAREEKAAKEKEEEERKAKEKAEQEEREKKEQEEKDRIKKEEEEKARIAEEERKKVEEQERAAEEERKKVEAKNAAAEELKRKEEEEKARLEEEERAKRAEELRLEEERINKEIAELERQQREEEERIKKEAEEAERARKEAEEAKEKARKERVAALARQQQEQREQREREMREREEKEKEKAKAPSIGFGGWGSITSSLFGGGTPEPQKQQESVFGGGWSGGLKRQPSNAGLKKQPSNSSIARSAVNQSLSRKPSAIFDQKSGAWGGFGSAAMKNDATTSLFGSVTPGFGEFGMNDLRHANPAASDDPFAPLPPAKDDDAWGFGDTLTKKDDKKADSPPQPDSPEALQVPYKPPTDSKGNDDAWALSDLSNNGKKKGKVGDLISDSQQPTRTSSPTPTGDDIFETPNQSNNEAEPEDAWGFTAKEKKKKGKKGKGAGDETPTAATPVKSPQEGEEALADKLAELLDGGQEGVQTPTAEQVDDEWALPVKIKKGKKGKNAAGAGAESEAEPAAAPTTTAGKKKKKGKK